MIFEILIDAYYELDDIMTEDEFYELFPDDTIIKLEYLKVDDNYMNMGIGHKLMKYGMDDLKDDKQFYLNASPMGNYIDVETLSNFYKKYGFEILLNQGHNILMIKKD